MNTADILAINSMFQSLYKSIGGNSNVYNQSGKASSVQRVSDSESSGQVRFPNRRPQVRWSPLPHRD
ncbi:hypothetical protein TITUS_055 [Escherichia phage vB_Eco_Titus]|nr:hypothetical protein TITUS_055 [Escherichia phage vB_Eco_Titus]